MGTLNVLEMIKNFKVKSAIFVTTDKCYKNLEIKRGYKETDIIGGKDIYSSSKACCEILIKSYRDTYYKHTRQKSIVSVRAGNVIGGGDFNKYRIIPDFYKALSKELLNIRNPYSVRPWQYVLDVIRGYILVAEEHSKIMILFLKLGILGLMKKVNKVKDLLILSIMIELKLITKMIYLMMKLKH